MAGGTHWGIVGGGMLGLTLAHRLAARGNRVTVLESGERLGGLADAWQLGDITWDRHYHVILPVDRALLSLLGELDLAGDIAWARTGTDLFDGNNFHPLNGGLDFLRLPMLSLLDKGRLAATILHASHIKDGTALSDTGVEDWLVKLSGRRVFDTIWRPLLRAKLGDTYKDASAQFIQAIARRLYSARANGVARDRFGTVRGGYARILKRLEQSLRKAGVTLETSTPVSAIESVGGRHHAICGPDARAFDRIIVTAPPPHAAQMCTGLNLAEKARLEGVRYQGVICASALLTKPLRGSYMTYITDETCPLTTVIDMSAALGPDSFGGRTLAYLPMYLASDNALFDAGEAELEAVILGGLSRLYPGIGRDDIAALRISRARHVLPVPVRGYARRMPAMVTSVPGLYTVNSANILNGTLNVNETIELADRALEDICADIRPMLLAPTTPRAAE